MGKNAKKSRSKQQRAAVPSEYNNANNHQVNHLARQEQNPIGKHVYNQNKKGKHSFTRIAVDPAKKYHTPESREAWGPNVKGKKFKKEKGKKKRCSNSGVKIDGTVNSIRFDSR